MWQMCSIPKRKDLRVAKSWWWRASLYFFHNPPLYDLISIRAIKITLHWGWKLLWLWSWGWGLLELRWGHVQDIKITWNWGSCCVLTCKAFTSIIIYDGWYDLVFLIMFDDTCLRTCRGCLQPQIFHEKTWFCDFITWGKFCTYSDTLKNISSWNSCSFIFAKKMSRRQWHILNLCFNRSSASVFEVVVEIIRSNHSNCYKKWYQNLAVGFPSAFNSFQTGIFVCNAIFFGKT